MPDAPFPRRLKADGPLAHFQWTSCDLVADPPAKGFGLALDAAGLQRLFERVTERVRREERDALPRLTAEEVERRLGALK